MKKYTCAEYSNGLQILSQTIEADSPEFARDIYIARRLDSLNGDSKIAVSEAGWLARNEKIFDCMDSEVFRKKVRLEKESAERKQQEAERKDQAALTECLKRAKASTGYDYDLMNQLVENYDFVMENSPDVCSPEVWDLRIQIFNWSNSGWFKLVYDAYVQRQIWLNLQLITKSGSGRKGSGDKTTHLGLAANLMTMAAMSRAVSAIEDNTEEMSEGFGFDE